MVYRLDALPEDGIDPVTKRPYDDSWLIWQLTDETGYTLTVGRCAGAYTIKYSRAAGPWAFSLGDFIGFHQQTGKSLLLVLSQADMDAAREKYRGHRFDEPILREDEQPYTVHSTPLENWVKIRHDGCLKSWNILRAEDAISEDRPIGSALGDPADFSDYIMFGGHVAGELVVNSRQQGKIVMDKNASYLTGARLYLDMKRIVEDGRAVRDGAHLKVRDRLPLAPYLLWAATWETVGLESRRSTPAIFCEKADRAFFSRFPQYARYANING